MIIHDMFPIALRRVSVYGLDIPLRVLSVVSSPDFVISFWSSSIGYTYAQFLERRFVDYARGIIHRQWQDCSS